MSWRPAASACRGTSSSSTISRSARPPSSSRPTPSPSSRPGRSVTAATASAGSSRARRAGRGRPRGGRCCRRGRRRRGARRRPRPRSRSRRAGRCRRGSPAAAMASLTRLQRPGAAANATRSSSSETCTPSAISWSAMPGVASAAPASPGSRALIGLIALKRWVTARAPAAKARGGLARRSPRCGRARRRRRGATQSSISSSAPGSSGASVTILTGPAASSRSSSRGRARAGARADGCLPGRARGTALRGGRRRSRPRAVAGSRLGDPPERGDDVGLGARDQRRLVGGDAVAQQRRAERRRARPARPRARRLRRSRSPGRRRAPGSRARGRRPASPTAATTPSRDRDVAADEPPADEGGGDAEPPACPAAGAGRRGRRRAELLERRPQAAVVALEQPARGLRIARAGEQRRGDLRAPVAALERGPGAPRASTPAISATIRVARSRSLALVARRSTIRPP